MIAIRDAPDTETVEAWLRRFVDGSCDDLVLMRLLGFARRMDLESACLGDGKDHLLPGKCDPRKCPVEINREKRGTPPLKRSLCRHVGEKDRPLVAQFRASSGQFGEGRARAGKPATRWLCWQSEANPSLPAILGIAG